MANLTVVLRCETYFWVFGLTIKIDPLEQASVIIEYTYTVAIIIICMYVL